MSRRHRQPTTVAGALRPAAAGLLAMCAGACATPATDPGQGPARADTAMSTGNGEPSAGRIPPRVSPGYEVPGTRVSIPRAMKAGTTVEAMVPAGAVVDAFGTRIVAPADGRIRLEAPRTPGEHAVLVQAPGKRSPMRLVVNVTAGE